MYASAAEKESRVWCICDRQIAGCAESRGILSVQGNAPITACPLI